MQFMLELKFKMNKWSQVMHQNWGTEKIRNICPLYVSKANILFIPLMCLIFQHLCPNNIFCCPNTYFAVNIITKSHILQLLALYRCVIMYYVILLCCQCWGIWYFLAWNVVCRPPLPWNMRTCEGPGKMKLYCRPGWSLWKMFFKYVIILHKE